MRRRGFPRRGLAWFLAAIAALGIWWFQGYGGGELSWPGAPAPTVEVDNGALLEVIAKRHSGEWVLGGGIVERILPDDRTGDQHQRFIVRVAPGHTVLIAHNIDLAERVLVEVGDGVEFRGRFEWNDRGGVVHWTHEDPQGRRDGGWIRRTESTYR